ncbi:hypothetical protein B0H19DRAFT_1239343 [Mycena capillaripes]|nr:hypothetical protein B0H19DRAFT_1239343 [Mycena capillaripes]
MSPIIFNTDVDLYDEHAVMKYHSRLETARSRAPLSPLIPGVGFSLDLVVPPANSVENVRSLPTLPPRSTQIHLRLERALQAGVDKLSQVWTALVDLPHTPSAMQTRLVLKIVQPSLCPYPRVDDIWPGNYTFPEYMASREAWVYEQLKHKQGRFIPYFFGMHTIITPSDESAWALVLEHIPGDTLQLFTTLPTKTIPRTRELITLSINTLTAFMADVFVDLYSAAKYEPDEIGRAIHIHRLQLFCDICESLSLDKDTELQLQSWAGKEFGFGSC